MSDSSPTSQDASGLEAYDYELPAELIAQRPCDRRDGGRLMLVDRRSGEVANDSIRSLASILRRGDLLIFNDVRVRPARLFGRLDRGGRVELLLLRQNDEAWQCLGRPGRRFREGTQVAFPDNAVAHVVGRSDDGRVEVRFEGVGDMEAYLARHGEIPLPPYIKRAAGPSAEDNVRYQTVFADRVGAVAAPTAGLHFSQELLQEVREGGVETAFVTLDVGPATFLPLRSVGDGDNQLEGESAAVSAETIAAIERTKTAGGRVIAVGTTTTRALESRAASQAGLTAGEFLADSFIRPGFEFRVIDGLLTNFHLPKSTLLMLVSAFAGRSTILDAYAAAVAARYRFYSYGDAMLIV